MEPLAYIHLALALEELTDADRAASISTTKSQRLLIWLSQQKLSTRAAYSLLAFGVALGISGRESMASAMVRQGDRGKEVTALQQRLAELGYYQGNVTGYFGSVTKKAVKKFQQDRGLEADGVVGENTEVSLRERSLSSFSDDLLQMGDRGDKVVTIQRQLAAAGFSGGDKGIFDDATEDAVRQFQQAKKLKVDGIVGPQTLAAMTAIDESNQKKAPAKTPSWYEDKSAPLTPFTR